MTSSPNKPVTNREWNPYEIGVALGLASGLMAHSLFNTKSGRDFSSWLKKHITILNEEIHEVKATNRSKTYQELSHLIEELKQTPNLVSEPTVKPTTLWLKKLQTHLFAQTPASSVPVSTKKVSASRQFFHQAAPRHHRSKS